LKKSAVTVDSAANLLYKPKLLNVQKNIKWSGTKSFFRNWTSIQSSSTDSQLLTQEMLSIPQSSQRITALTLKPRRPVKGKKNLDLCHSLLGAFYWRLLRFVAFIFNQPIISFIITAALLFWIVQNVLISSIASL